MTKNHTKKKIFLLIGIFCCIALGSNALNFSPNSSLSPPQVMMEISTLRERLGALVRVVLILSLPNMTVPIIPYLTSPGVVTAKMVDMVLR